MTPRQSHRSDDETDEATEPAKATTETVPTDEGGTPPGVIDGPFGTTVDSADENVASLRVEVKSNVTLGNQLRTVGQKVEVPDDAESRGAIAVGHLRLLDDDESLDSDS